jgi:hypothetical protein
VIEIKSAKMSKINWTQLIAAVAMLLTMFGLDITPEHQAAAVVVIGLISQFATVIWKTWFTTTITRSSAELAGLPLK